ncbi:phosphotransferase [Streptomyces sp. NPDC055681]
MPRRNWIHGDLAAGNLLTVQGRLSAVIDLGTPAVGDPAVDLLPAWLFLPAGAPDVFRTALDVDDATWARGRGRALASSLPVPDDPYSDDPARARAALRHLDELVADLWIVRTGPARARSERDSPQPRQSPGEVPGSVSARPSWARSVIQRAGR